MKTLAVLRDEKKQLAALLGYLDSWIEQTAGDVRRLRRQIARRQRRRKAQS